jgi:hypothetical protein
MKIIGLDKWTGSYSEIGQTNPLRWQNLCPLADGAYEVVSHKWKCKDFMNEVVTSFHTKREFSIYGFNVNYNKFFSEGQADLPILLHNVLPGWEANMQVVNDYLDSQDCMTLDWEKFEGGKYVITIPGLYLMNTLFMSQVTLFIRLANTTKDYASDKDYQSTLQDMCNDSINKQDTNNLAQCFKKPLKDFSKALQDYIWYYDPARNLKHDAGLSTPIQTSLMHNCGVVSWGWVEEEECV